MAMEVDTEAPLSVAGRLNRAVSFYSAAIPIFASYKLLDRQFKFQRETLGQTISEEKVEEEFKKLHEWGSEILKVKIEDLKGEKLLLLLCVTHRSVSFSFVSLRDSTKLLCSYL